MHCPVCQYAFTFSQFVKLTNPAQIVCPRCGAKLKIAGIRAIVAIVFLCAIVYLVPAIAVSDQFVEPANYAVLAVFGLGFLFVAGYIVYRKCILEQIVSKH